MQASDYIVVANQLHLHQLSLDGNRVKTLVSGLGFAVAVDFDFRFGIIIATPTCGGNNVLSLQTRLLILDRQNSTFHHEIKP